MLLRSSSEGNGCEVLLTIKLILTQGAAKLPFS
jgi:hypothetical protein